VWCILGKHFRKEVDVLSLTCSDNQVSQRPVSPTAASVTSDAATDDAWWSSGCRDLKDVISVLSRQVSYDVYKLPEE